MNTFILFCCTFFISICITAQTTVTINSSAGELGTHLSNDNIMQADELVISGSMDARDFYSLNQVSLPNLYTLNLKNVTIEKFEGRLTPTSPERLNKAHTITESAIGSDVDSLVLPASLLYIDAFGFNRARNIRHLVVPENVVSIGTRAFNNNPTLTSIVLPASLKKIDKYCFNYCLKLQTVEIKGNLDTIHSNAFYYCNALESIHIEGVRVIERAAFNYCTSLKTIYLPDGLEYMESNAFNYCTSLKYIRIPGTLKEIPAFAFNNCLALETLIIEEGVTKIFASAFSNCRLLNKLQLASTIEYIGFSAFVDIGNVGTLSLPDSLHTINASAFLLYDEHDSYISSLIIPKKVDSISPLAFSNQRGLENIYAYPFIPIPITTNDAVFENLDKTNCTLFVPYGSKAMYDTAEVWKDFAVINEFDIITVSESDIEVSAAETEYSVELYSYGTCRITASEDWVHVNYDTLENTFTLDIQIDENLTNESRTCIITISYNPEDEYLKSGYTKEIIVSQEGAIETVYKKINTNTIACYPNPASSYIIIPDPAIHTIRIFDNSGKLVLFENIGQTNIVSISKLLLGTYTIQFLAADFMYTDMLHIIR
ncbi:MAG: leucine-rich repeat protein [Bacteroidales bacterium]